MSLPDLALDAAGVHAYLHEVWPEVAHRFEGAITDLRPGRLRFRKPTGPDDIRPGGTVSGPTLMAAADEAAYAMVLAHLGGAALAVTSHLSIEFLRRPSVGELVLDVEVLKLGRTQVTMAVRIAVDDPDSPPVAVATVIYSRALLAG